MKRLNWIDELKGFILILVCLGHTNINIPLGGEFNSNYVSHSNAHLLFLIRNIV